VKQVPFLTLNPRRRSKIRLKRTLHRWIDPVLSVPNHRRAAERLRDLPDGEYHVPIDVPYVPQFASTDLIKAYIHDQLHGRDDPNWQAFGAPDTDTYTFWAHRACAIACVKMAIDGYQTAPPKTLWQLVDEGLSLGGYRTHDQNGIFIDEGWYYTALVELGKRYGLDVQGKAYASILDVCAAIRDGWLVAAGVTPELGEHAPIHKYDGHFVLVYAFSWHNRRCTSLTLHNPSGRYLDLQAGAVIPYARFRAAFARRFIAFRPKS
jgi:hypothetical protein